MPNASAYCKVKRYFLIKQKTMSDKSFACALMCLNCLARHTERDIDSSKLPFGDMAHIKLSYDFDLEISAGSVLGF